MKIIIIIIVIISRKETLPAPPLCILQPLEGSTGDGARVLEDSSYAQGQLDTRISLQSKFESQRQLLKRLFTRHSGITSASAFGIT